MVDLTGWERLGKQWGNTGYEPGKPAVRGAQLQPPGTADILDA